MTLMYKIYVDGELSVVRAENEAAFEKLRGWRQNELKRKVGLF